MPLVDLSMVDQRYDAVREVLDRAGPLRPLPGGRGQAPLGLRQNRG